ncbi:MAG: hydrogenase expression/formation protein HypE [Candidatus Omnitrophota bacterium]
MVVPEKISLREGEGTRSSYELIRNVFLKRFSNPALNELSDAAAIGDLVFSCDSFTVDPIFFPSSDIGKLSIYGTVNDLCVSAGEPLYISLAVIVEEGFGRGDLERIADSIKAAARDSGVTIVTGDFKVVEKGKADKIFISTSGIGTRVPRRSSAGSKITHNDSIIVTGPIAEHGISVMLARKKIFEFKITSDCQSLRSTLIPLWKRFSAIRFMRDPTRGGIAASLNEISLSTGLGVRIYEEKVPLRKDVNAACEILGIDPYYLASEGRALIVVGRNDATTLLRVLRAKNPRAAIIGEIDKHSNAVTVVTRSGGERILDFSRALNVPRIC